jgi:hypothetical protein
MRTTGPFIVVTLATSRSFKPSPAKSSVSRVARLCKQGVTGSIPVTSTNLLNSLLALWISLRDQCSDFCSDSLTLLDRGSANNPCCAEFLEFLHRRLFLFGCRVNVTHGHQNTREITSVDLIGNNTSDANLLSGFTRRPSRCNN